MTELPSSDRTTRALTCPADGLPDLVLNENHLQLAAQSLAAGFGPVAVDAERASGYRYGQAAYLVQLRRQGSGTWLIDPVCCPDLSLINEAISSAEWILHAASQDLACLAELGLRPTALFDTELAARIAGLPRVGLGAVVERLLGICLAKEHSAVDWSTRPLPQSWLNYAALDVELLIELRESLAEILVNDGKWDWAQQEFEATRGAPLAPVRIDPWRRLNGLHRLRTPRALGIARELWLARDALARKRDIAPGRVLPDAAITAAVTAQPSTLAELVLVPGFTGPAGRRHGAHWLAALARGRALTEAALPVLTLPFDGPPPPRAWADRDPIAAARLRYARDQITLLAEEIQIPVENLMTPDTVRRIMWQPPTEAEDLPPALAALNARPWQIELLTPILREALRQTPESYPISKLTADPPPSALTPERS